MKLKMDTGYGDLIKVIADEIKGGEKAVTSAMSKSGLQLKALWRRQVTSAGLGERLGKTVRNRTFPEGDESLNAAALVWSRAPEIFIGFDTGAIIRPWGRRFLAIPLPAAGKKPREHGRSGRFKRVSGPAAWERRTGVKLRLVARPGKPYLLVAEGRINSKGVAVKSRSKTGRGLSTVPVFVLIPQVKLRKRLDLERDVRRVENGVPGRIVEEWVSVKRSPTGRKLKTRWVF